MQNLTYVLIALAMMLSAGTSVLAQVQPRIQFPNGSDYLIAGDTVTIRWEGVTTADTVKLEYSLDDGKTWMLISDVAVGLEHHWKVPALETHTGLMRVTARIPGAQQPERLFARRTYGLQYTLAFSANDSLYLATSQGDHAYAVNRYTGQYSVLRDSDARYGSFDRTGRYMITMRSNGEINVWDIGSRTQIGAVNIGERPYSCDISYDNRRVIVAGKTGVYFYDFDSLKSGIESLPPSYIHRREGISFHCAHFSPSDKLIALGCSDRSIEVVDGSTYASLRVFVTYPGTERLKFSRDDRHVVATGNSNILGSVWDLYTGSYVRGVELRSNVSNEIVWGRGDSVVAVVGTEGKGRILDANTFQELYVLPDKGLRKIAVSHDGNAVVAGRGDSSILYSLPREKSTIADVSDDNWSVGPILSVTDLSRAKDQPTMPEVHPNPASSGARITFENPALGDVFIRIADCLGQEFVRQDHVNLVPGLHSVSIDTSRLPTGTYVCTVTTRDRSYSRSFVVIN